MNIRVVLLCPRLAFTVGHYLVPREEMGSSHQSLVVEGCQHLLKGPDNCEGQVLLIFIHHIFCIYHFLSTSIATTLVEVLTLNYFSNFYAGHLDVSLTSA